MNHRHSGAILLRYTRDNTKNLDQIAAEIFNQVKNNNSDNGTDNGTSQSSSADSTPSAKRRKINSKKYENIQQDNTHIDTNELQRRVAAILGHTRHRMTHSITHIMTHEL